MVKRTAAERELIREAGQYASAHSHPANQVIHFVFVPVIIFSLFVALDLLRLTPLAASSSPPAAGDDGALPAQGVSLGKVVAVLACSYYLKLHLLVGLILSAFFAAVEVSAQATIAHFLAPNGGGVSGLLVLVLVCQVVGWGLQVVVGHGHYEKRSPALTNSLFQIVISPFFLVLEALFMSGWNPTLRTAVNTHARRVIAREDKAAAAAAAAENDDGGEEEEEQEQVKPRGRGRKTTTSGAAAKPKQRSTSRSRSRSPAAARRSQSPAARRRR